MIFTCPDIALGLLPRTIRSPSLFHPTPLSSHGYEKIYLCGHPRKIWSRGARGSGKNPRSAYSLSDTGEAEKIDDGRD
jgi:hypothetical protein